MHYIPRKDVDMSLLERTDHETNCPYKGDKAVASIEDHFAFHPERVDEISKP